MIALDILIGRVAKDKRFVFIVFTKNKLYEAAFDRFAFDVIVVKALPHSFSKLELLELPDILGVLLVLSNSGTDMVRAFESQ